MNPLAPITAVFKAIAAYYEFKTERAVYDMLLDAKDRRTKLEEDIIRISTDGGIASTARDRLLGISDMQLREHQALIRRLKTRLGNRPD